jgi:hypothetical protein
MVAQRPNGPLFSFARNNGPPDHCLSLASSQAKAQRFKKWVQPISGSKPGVEHVPTINQEKSGVLFESKRKRFHFFMLY